MIDNFSHTAILIGFPPLIEVWVQTLWCFIRLKLYLNLLMEVKTSARVVWQQQCSSRAQRTEGRKVLIVSLSVTCKSKKDFIMSKQIYANRIWNSPVSAQKFSKPQKWVNIISCMCKAGKKRLLFTWAYFEFRARCCHLSVTFNFCSWKSSITESKAMWAVCFTEQYIGPVENHSIICDACLSEKLHFSLLDSI